MSLQGSIHKKSDGIGYGAFIPTERAYYNVRTPTASARVRRPPSSETTRDYRRHNVTAGIDTHRSDISFGRTTESIRGGVVGDSRAKQAIKSLTSGEVGGFMWPAGRPRTGDITAILASSANRSRTDIVGGSTTTPITSSVQSAQIIRQNKQAAQGQVAEDLQKQRERGGANRSLNSARSCTSSNGSGGSTTWRSDATSSSSASSMSSPVSYDSSSSSRLSSARSSCCSTSSNRRTRRPMIPPPTSRSARLSENGANNNNSSGQRTRRSTNGNRTETTRLRPISLAAPPGASERSPSIPRVASPATARLPQFKTLDPVFQPHHKYDMIAEDRAARGGEVTGRFGPVDGSSVLAASLLTSELSTPWSHVLRGQRW